MYQQKASLYATSDEYRENLRIAVAVRWFVVVAWLVQHNYRINLAEPAYVETQLLVLSVGILNGYVAWRIWKGLSISLPFAAALSALDLTTVTLGILLTSRFESGFFVLYYPALAVVAVVFTSRKVSFGVTTVVALIYVWMSFFLEPRLDIEGMLEKVLFIRIVTMYALVVVVNLITSFERDRRREAVKAAKAAEQALQVERIRISEEIHDGAAQSAHVLSLGL